MAYLNAEAVALFVAAIGFAAAVLLCGLSDSASSTGRMAFLAAVLSFHVPQIIRSVSMYVRPISAESSRWPRRDLTGELRSVAFAWPLLVLLLLTYGTY